MAGPSESNDSVLGVAPLLIVIADCRQIFRTLLRNDPVTFDLISRSLEYLENHIQGDTNPPNNITRLALGPLVHMIMPPLHQAVEILRGSRRVQDARKLQAAWDLLNKFRGELEQTDGVPEA